MSLHFEVNRAVNAHAHVQLVLFQRILNGPEQTVFEECFDFANGALFTAYDVRDCLFRFCLLSLSKEYLEAERTRVGGAKLKVNQTQLSGLKMPERENNENALAWEIGDVRTSNHWRNSGARSTSTTLQSKR